MGYRNMLEKVAERYHTTPRHDRRAQRPRQADRRRPDAAACPMSFRPARDYRRSPRKGPNIGADRSPSSTSTANQPQGDHVVVDKTEGVLKVYGRASGKLVAQFPVTMGSSKIRCRSAAGRSTTYAFLPPFHYQPDLFWDVNDSKDEQMLPAGAERPGRGRLARPDQGALRHPRHQRAADHRPRRKPSAASA